MFSYQFYVVMHVTGLILLFSALGGASASNMHGKHAERSTARRVTAILHGVGLLLLLVGGFGLMARLGIKHGEPWPAWLVLKFVIWLVMGGVIVALRRAAGTGVALALLLPLLGTTAVYLAKYKPLQPRPAAVIAPVDPSPSAGEPASDVPAAGEETTANDP
jgi:uncharacterized membrane protein SirB2